MSKDKLIFILITWVIMGISWPVLMYYIVKVDVDEYAKLHGPCLEYGEHMYGPVSVSICEKWSK